MLYNSLNGLQVSCPVSISGTHFQKICFYLWEDVRDLPAWNMPHNLHLLLLLILVVSGRSPTSRPTLPLEPHNTVYLFLLFSSFSFPHYSFPLEYTMLKMCRTYFPRSFGKSACQCAMSVSQPYHLEKILVEISQSHRHVTHSFRTESSGYS